jgi:o-succinylbenzoate synthase
MKFQFNIYQRPFKQPLLTSHGIWQIREGIIISLNNGVKIAQGEIAPLSWFGSETMSEAIEFCQQLGETISIQDINTIPDNFPACQFGLESALLGLNSFDSNIHVNDLDCCYLLPAGKSALTAWQAIYQRQGNNTFKWKIGVYPLEQEIKILQQLVKILPPKVQLRLDANGGLDLTQTKKLLTVTDSLKTIEFIEQPLPPEGLAQMLQLSQEHTTLLGLDESVANFPKLRFAHQQGWSGIFVVKAAIMGFPSRLIAYCQQHSLDVVFSSVLETEIGRNAVLSLAQQLDHPRAVGFGVNHY